MTTTHYKNVLTVSAGHGYPFLRTFSVRNDKPRRFRVGMGNPVPPRPYLTSYSFAAKTAWQILYGDKWKKVAERPSVKKHLDPNERLTRHRTLKAYARHRRITTAGLKRVAAEINEYKGDHPQLYFRDWKKEKYGVTTDYRLAKTKHSREIHYVISGDDPLLGIADVSRYVSEDIGKNVTVTVTYKSLTGDIAGIAKFRNGERLKDEDN